MTNKHIVHVGLQVVDKDVVSFYEDVLQGTVIRSFVLPEELCGEIFNIHQQTTIVCMMCDGFELELFVSDCSENQSFNHLCVESFSAEDIYNAAVQSGYVTYKRSSKNGGYTYFIKDSCANIFEIKLLSL
ncbi:MAG: VOC family protein [Bacteroidales bacterium]